MSLTSQCCKLLEAIIRDGVIEYLDKYNVLTDSQHGFRTGRSCLSLLSFFDQVSEGVDTGTAIDVIYLDFAKAFDKVPHERLLYKLDKYGIRGKQLGFRSGTINGPRTER